MCSVKTTEHSVTVPFDLSAGHDIEFYCAVGEIADQSPPVIHLDCSSLDPVHSSHIGMLWIAKEICTRQSVRISLENANVSLIRTLQVLDLADIFEINKAAIQEPVAPPTTAHSGQGSEQHSGDFLADMSGVDLGLRQFMEFIDDWQFDEVVKFDLRTIFYEVANNIACHSGLTSDARIQYQVTCADGELRLVFEDNGKPFDPLSLPDNFDPEDAARKHQTRGFGISLIQRLADSIEYTHRDNTTNVLSLVKRHGER